MAPYDILGNVAVVKFDKGLRVRDKKKIASAILKQHKSIRTILEKADRFKGRLRTLKTKWVAGEKTKEVLYRENNCEFRFSVDDCYFSSRLSTDREEVAKQVKKGERVLVMFSGVGVYGIVIGKNSRAREVVCVELSRKCSKYAKENVKRNKLDNVEIVQGDVRRVFKKDVGKSKNKNVQGVFDRIVMARPNLKDDFLDIAFSVCKKGSVIHYHGFYHELEFKAGVLDELILRRAKESKKRVKILRKKKAGEIAPYKYRYRVDFKIMN